MLRGLAHFLVKCLRISLANRWAFREPRPTSFSPYLFRSYLCGLRVLAAQAPKRGSSLTFHLSPFTAPLCSALGLTNSVVRSIQAR
jgi:hypothetical protein